MAKIVANGTTVSWNALLIPGIQSFDAPSGSDVPDIDATDLDSAVESSEPGIPVPGTARIVFHCDPDNATYVALKADRDARTKRTLKRTLPSGTNKVRTWTNCYIKSLDDNGSKNGMVTATCVIKLNSAWADAAT